MCVVDSLLNRFVLTVTQGTVGSGLTCSAKGDGRVPDGQARVYNHHLTHFTSIPQHYFGGNPIPGLKSTLSNTSRKLSFL